MTVLNRPRKARIDKVGAEWRTWIPVRDAGDYDESRLHPAAPYGESFYPTWLEAVAFADLVRKLEEPG